MIGKTISHYRIIEKLGEGGMGVVYKAEDLKLNRVVALKFLSGHLVEDANAKARFIQEARAAAALQHPNIAVIHDFIESSDKTIIVMEYLEGETLAQKIELQKTNLNQILDWITEIAGGLAAAHKKGITHRDIKPENIVVATDGMTKILDFGVAKLRGTQTLTEPGTRIGTVDYAAPELVMGDKGDYRSDIFSLGVVLYELLTGQRPFQGNHDAAVVYAIVNEAPKLITHFRKDIPPALEHLVDKMLEKKKDKRYPSFDELLADLKEAKRNITTISNSERKIEERKKQKTGFQRHKKEGVVIRLIKLIRTKLQWSTTRSETINSIAVLPLDNYSGDPAEEYFSDGMTDALITNLAKISSLKVISRTSVMPYKDTDKSLPEIARELNVDAIIEGSVLRAGDEVRITAQLIEAATDRHLWAENYERNLRDVLALQSEVAKAICREIELKMTPQQQVRLANTRPINPEAYEAYLKGRYFLNTHSVDSYQKSIKYFEEAIEKDPAYANAYMGMAESYIMLAAPSIEVLPPRETMPKARAAAAQALKLDDQSGEAHTMMGNVKLYYDWDLPGAEREFKQAFELNPGNASTYAHYATLLSLKGRHEECIEAIKRAIELDPLSLTFNASWGTSLFIARQYDRAIKKHLNTLEMNPNNWHIHWGLGLFYAHKGMYKKAIAEGEKGVMLSDRNATVLSYLGYIYGLGGKKDEAMKILDEVMNLSKQKYVSPYAVMLIHTGLGDREQAFKWLEKAYQERSNGMVWLGVQPLNDSLRSDPRFDELLNKVGLEYKVDASVVDR